MAQTKFTPRKKNDVVNELKEALLNGNIIRYDGYHTKVEVLPRRFKNIVSGADNLFQSTGPLRSYYNDESITKKTIEISGRAIGDALNALREDYVVTKVCCSGSGCCQYATYAVYLEGE